MEKLTNLEGVYNSETEKLRNDVERLQLSEEEAKVATGRVLSLQEEIAKLRKDLEQTRSEKKSIEERADKYKQETEQVQNDILIPLPLAQSKCCHPGLIICDTILILMVYTNVSQTSLPHNQQVGYSLEVRTSENRNKTMFQQ